MVERHAVIGRSSEFDGPTRSGGRSERRKLVDCAVLEQYDRPAGPFSGSSQNHLEKRSVRMARPGFIQGKGDCNELIEMDARLKILSGLLSGKTVRIPRKLLVGRAEDCDLRLESNFVSKYHCVLLLDDYTLRIRDLGSKNGTFVNGRRVGASTVILLHDDSVSIGETNLLIELAPRTPETEPTGSQPEPESSSNRSVGTVLSDGDTVRADVAEMIPPPSVSKLAVPSDFPPASHPVNPPQRQEGGNG